MQDKNTLTLVGLGEILWDMLPDGKRLGGAPANFAYHAQALEATGVPVSQVGADDLGREIRDKLGELGLDRDHVTVDDTHPTGTVSVDLDENGQPHYVIHEGVAWDCIAWSASHAELAARADGVCFGTLCQRSRVSRDTINTFLAQTRPDCLRVLDINLRQSYWSRETIHSLLGFADVLKLNDEEMPIVTRLLDIDGTESGQLRQLADGYGLKLIALTRGAKGSTLFDREGTSVHEGFDVRVVDTVGAGDAFTAAMVIGLLKGRDLDRINADANRVASFVCSQSGATPVLPAELVAVVTA